MVLLGVLLGPTPRENRTELAFFRLLKRQLYLIIIRHFFQLYLMTFASVLLLIEIGFGLSITLLIFLRNDNKIMVIAIVFFLFGSTKSLQVYQSRFLVAKFYRTRPNYQFVI